ncbi:MAG: hypothetical protein IPP77_05770 [Bacteroidetes bacterium]|nr:hypothetical protein [Bacteroidota bacterium]
MFRICSANKWVIIGACLFLFTSLFSQEDNFEWIRKINGVKGKVTMLEFEQTWIIIPDENPNGRYFSNQLPDEYKKEGLKVSFCGMVGKIPPNVRLLATPLKLSCICISKKEKKKFGLNSRKYKF